MAQNRDQSGILDAISTVTPEGLVGNPGGSGVESMSAISFDPTLFCKPSQRKSI